MLAQEGQAEPLSSSKEELRWRASILTACVSPGGYGMVDVFPPFSASQNNPLETLNFDLNCGPPSVLMCVGQPKSLNHCSRW